MKPLKILLPALILLAAAVIFWYKLVFTGSAFFFGLTTEYFYPIYAFLSQAVRSLREPLWNPFVMGGLPFLANPQSAVYYPFSYIFVILPFAEAFSLNVLLHTFLAGIFMYALARNMGIGKTGSFGAAVIYMFNGYFVFHFEFLSNTSSYIWAPLVMLFFRRALDGETGVNSAAAGFFLAIQLFAGHPQFVYYTAGLLLVYAAAFSPLKGARSLTIACLVFIGLAAAQIIPALELLPFTARVKGIDYAASVIYSVRPIDMLRFLFVPFWDILNRVYVGDPHIIAFYSGIAPLLIVILSFVRRPAKLQIFFACVFGCSLLLALGKYFPLYSIFMSIVPGWKFFKFPGQVLFLSVFSFSLLFGFALNRIGNNTVKIILVLICFTELFIFGQNANTLIDRSFYNTPTPRIEFLKKDPGLFRFSMAPQVRDMEPEKSRSARTEFQYWLNYKDMLLPNSGGAYGLFCADGRETLKLSRYTDLLDKIDSAHSPILNLLNVKYMLLPWELKTGNSRLVKKGYINIYLNTDCMPRFSMVDGVKPMKDNEILGYMAKGFDPRQAVIIDERAGKYKYYGKESGVSGPDLVTVNNYSANIIDLTVNTSRPRWLLASESYFPGWKAEIDGEKADIIRADYALRALPVNKGSHKVVMFYDPWTVKAGRAVSLLTLAGLLTWFLIYLRKRE
jgi:hypothetical protein